MTSDRDTGPPKAVDALIDGLRGEGPGEAPEPFTMDRETARQKMARFQLPDNRFYVLELVQAGVLRGATRIVITTENKKVVVAYHDGDPFELDELENVYGSLFSGSQDPHRASQQRLAVALNAASALKVKDVLLRSGEAELHIKRGEPEQWGPAEKPLSGTRIEISHQKLNRTGLVSLLKERCQYAEVTVIVDGTQVSRGYAFRLGVGEVELNPPVGRGCAGFPLEAKDRSQVRLVANDVWITSHSVAATIQGFVAVADVSHLRKDLSQVDVIRDDAYRELMSAVHQAHTPAIERVTEQLAGELHDTSLREWAQRIVRRAHAGYSEIDLFAGENADPTAKRLAALAVWPRAGGGMISIQELLATLQRSKLLRYVDNTTTKVPEDKLVLQLQNPDDKAFFFRVLRRKLNSVAPPAKKRTPWSPLVAKGLAGGVALCAVVMIGLIAALVHVTEERSKARRTLQQHRARLKATRDRKAALEAQKRRKRKRNTTQTGQSDPAKRPRPGAPAVQQGELKFPAKILTVRGFPGVKAGAACEVVWRFKIEKKKRKGQGVDVRCGKESLYRWNQSDGYGTILTQECELFDRFDTDSNRHELNLACLDSGARVGPRPQLALDTRRKQVRIWQDGLPRRAVLRVLPLHRSKRSHSWSGAAADLGVANRRLQAVVSKVTGTTPVKAGSLCDVTISPSDASFNCRIRILCGGVHIYGAGNGGYNHCKGKDAALTATDPGTSSKDGDPKLTMVLGESRIAVTDDKPSAWTVALKVKASSK